MRPVRLRRERERVAGGVAEPGGDLAVTGVEGVVGGDVGWVISGYRDPRRGRADAVTSSTVLAAAVAAVRAGSPSRMRPYDMELRGTVSMWPRSARPRPRPMVRVRAAVAPVRARRDRAGRRRGRLRRAAVSCSASSRVAVRGQALGEFVKSGEIGDPARQPVLDSAPDCSVDASRGGGRSLRRAGEITGLNPATFGR